MDYSKLTKKELLDLVTEQQALADAVNAKDKEIQKLLDQINQIKKSNQGEIETKTKELQEEIQKLTAEINNINKSNQWEIEAKTKQLQEEKKNIMEVANHYITAYRDLLKQQKINLDIAISHEALLSEKIK